MWAVTIVPTAILFSLLYYDWKLAWLSPFIQGAIMYLAFRPIAEICMTKGLADHYAAVGIVGADTTQPKYLHAALLRLKWFHDFLTSVTHIEKCEFERCIEFIELIAKDAPLSWTAYFRHPLPLLLLGIAIFLLNAKIVSLINSTTIAFGNLAIIVGVSVAWAVGMGWLLFALRHARAESRWFFLRCLRWTVLSIEQGESKAVVGRAETVVVGSPLRVSEDHDLRR